MVNIDIAKLCDDKPDYNVIKLVRFDGLTTGQCPKPLLTISNTV